VAVAMNMFALLLAVWVAHADPALAKLIVGADTFIDTPARFGTDPGELFGLSGQIVNNYGPDAYGCTSIVAPPQVVNHTWFALIDRGECEFGRKVLKAQQAGAAACIVVNDRPGFPVAMYSGNEVAEISIVAIMIEQVTGQIIRNEMAIHNMSFIRGTIIRDIEVSWQPFFLPCIVIFTVTVCISIAILWYKHCQRRVLQRSTMSPKTLTKKELRQLPVKAFHAGDMGPDAVETCRICLQELAEGVKIRVLPCRHYFRKACIDQWLLERSRACPLCTRDALGTDQLQAMAVPNERTGLLQRPESPVGDPEAGVCTDEGRGDGEAVKGGD